MNALPPLPCYLNGEFTELQHARVSVMDRGFIFGDGVYEVVPAYAGQLFRFPQHMARLERSLRELRIPNPLSRLQWARLAQRLIDTYASQHEGGCEPMDQLVYFQITRGVALRDHLMPEQIEPTVFAMTNALKPPSAAQRADGVACITAVDFRWEKAHIKSTSLLGSVLARQLGHDAGASETIMFRNQFLSEAAASNVWVVRNRTVLGPPKDNLVLEGIRYGLIEELCQQAGLEFALRPIPQHEVLTADELLLSSATKEVLPVTRLDGRPVGNGQPGPVYAQLYAAYQQAKAQARRQPATTSHTP